jgi:2',3'-cyclic-nucleotide 2'-phosphodiesterase (5'-nucleotidase family)
MFSPYIAPKLASTVLTLIEKIGYDAVGVGDQELSLDDFVQEIGKYKIPFLASNLSFCTGSQCKQLTPRAFSFERLGLKISVLSVIDPEVFALYPAKITEKVSIIPLDGVIKAFIAEQKDKADLKILISHCGFDADKALAQKYPEFDIIIGGHSQTVVSQPYRSGKTLIVQAGENAQNVGKLVLRIGENKQIESYKSELIPLTKDIPDDQETRAIVNEYKAKARK